MKNIFIVSILVLFRLTTANACSPYGVPILNNQNVAGTNLVLNWISTTGWSCSYNIVTEIYCTASTAGGPLITNRSGCINKGNSGNIAYPGPQTINLSGLCPGETYFFRAKESNCGSSAWGSGWTQWYSFVYGVGGAAFQVTANGAPIAICPGDCANLTSLATNNCQPGINYSWNNGGGAGANVTVCPAATTTYTVTATTVGACATLVATADITIAVASIPPTASNPPTINVQCSADVLPPDVNVVTDEASVFPNPPVVTFIGETTDGLSCPETIIRTYRVTDECGLFIDVTQTIIVDDTQNPIAIAPLDGVYQCMADVPVQTVADVTGVSDNCTANPVVAMLAETQAGTCPVIITRQYSVTDDCLNQIILTQVITVDDTQDPVAAPPLDATYQCMADVPVQTIADVTGVSDNCTANPVVAMLAETQAGTCPVVITRQYSVTDDCLNQIILTQVITVDDTQDPTASNPLPITVECFFDISLPDVNVVTDEADNCTVAPVVTFVGDVSNNQTCPETITRTYSVTDDCNNEIFVTQTITVNDITDPTASNPLPVIVECFFDIPLPDVNVVTDEADNCTAVLVVTFVSDVSNNQTCSEIITRTYRITDDCGNFIDVTQIITVDDITDPTASNPIPVNVECIFDVPATDINVVTDEADNCTAVPVVTFIDDVSNNQTCPEIITRTYRITDDCGNFTDVMQTITVNDITDPTASNPVPINVECFFEIPLPDINVVTDEADNCTAVPTVTWVDDVSNGQTCSEGITRTYSIMDDCGNEIFVTQAITVNDVTNPTASNPIAVNVECIGDVPVPNVNVVTDEADNCTVNPTVEWVSDVSNNQTCAEVITRTYSITDDCNNQILVTQTITIDDVTDPTASNPLPVNVECIFDVPLPDVTVVTDEADNCTTNPLVLWVNDASDNQTCPETIIRTYSITDACNNQILVIQTIIVNDVTAPTASNLNTISVPGSMDVPVPDVALIDDELDNCTAVPMVTWVSDLSDGNVCNLEEITRTYLIEDDCGNQTFVTQLIIILAVPPPINEEDTLICENESVTLVADNPWNVPIFWDNGVIDSQPFSPTQTLTYTVTADNLGCISTDVATVTIENLPTVMFTASPPICEPFEVTFTNQSFAGAPAGIIANCVWDIEGVPLINQCGDLVYTFTEAGLYDVGLTITSANNCVNSVMYTDLVDVTAMPIASFEASSTSLSTLDTEVEFTNTSEYAVGYLWDFGDSSATTSIENPVHIFPDDDDGSFTVMLVAFNSLDCTDTAWLEIRVTEELVFFVPNTFTPDNDAYNNTFQPVFVSGYDPYDFEMFIYNRWGEVVFVSHDASIGWDGTYGGKMMNDGTYTWKIETKQTENDKRIVVKGHVNIIR
ncbi:MAG: gliding motility-associated C-terminal domain-containing protein [Fluviicola sp.]|nr:gliding motility-associated C-terminal domain-containing protein [Fluviicola sp.]